MKVAVIGAGPSGLFAAWACIDYGYDVTVFDRDVRKVGVGTSHGVFALWSPCNLFLQQEVMVNIGIVGAQDDAEDAEIRYKEKVYGQVDTPVSISKYGQTWKRLAFNHDEAYTRISEMIGDRIREAVVTTPQDLINCLDHYDFVISTIPASVLWPLEDWPYVSAKVYYSSAPPDEAFMIYNANSYIDWYRCSAMFGHFTMEYPYARAHSNATVVVKKVIDAPKSPEVLIGPLQDRIYFTGRYGGWCKEMLTEEVYYDVLKICNARKAVRTPKGTTELLV